MTPLEQEIIKEFDEKFHWLETGGISPDDVTEDVKSFLHQSLLRYNEAIREDLVKMIKEHDDEGSGCGCTPRGTIMDVLELLDTNKKP